MSWASAIIQGVGALMQANDAKDRAEIQQRQAQAQKVANEAQAVLAENNAKIADWQAADALYRSSIAAGNVRTRTRQIVADQAAAAAGAGIAIGSGTIAALMADATTEGRIEEATVQFNGEREAWAFRMQALDSRNRAEILRKADIAVGVDPGSAFASSLVSSAAHIYRDYERSR